SRATAASRRLTVAGAYPRCSRWIRYRSTTVRLNARRGSEQYQATSSRIAWVVGSLAAGRRQAVQYCGLGVFRSGRARTRLGGLFLRDFDLDIGNGLLPLSTASSTGTS